MLVGGIVAAYSYLGALPSVLLIPVAVAACPDRSRTSLVVVSVASVLAFGLYFVGYPWGALGAPRGSEPSFELMPLLPYVLKYLGARFSAWDAGQALLWGCVGLAVSVTGIVSFARGQADHRRALVPWLFLMAFVGAAGLLTAAGRQGGPNAPLMSRFAMLPALFWAAVPPTVAISAGAFGWVRAPRPVKVVAVAGSTVLVVLAAMGYAANWRLGEKLGARRSAALAAGSACLEHRRPELQCLRLLSKEDPGLVLRMSRRLRRLELGPFSYPSGGA